MALAGGNEETVAACCRDTVERVAAALPGNEVSCVLREGDLLRLVAHAGRLRLIYEFPRSQGGVVWRTAELGLTQIVEDVARDPDYITVDESVRSEVTAPVLIDDRVVAVLNLESPGRILGTPDAAILEREAERLSVVLGPLLLLVAALCLA